MKSRRAAWLAWLLAAAFYFYQYALRSAPSVMIPQLSGALGLSAVAIASLTGVFYYGYSPFNLVAGTAIDRLGARAVLPIGALATGLGALLFAMGNTPAAYVGRCLQGAGGAFAFIGAAYVITRNLPASQAATLIGATQMFGMAGGSAGQFLVGPMIVAGIPWSTFWMDMAITGMGLAAALFFVLPKHQAGQESRDSLRVCIAALGLVFRNRQTILCGVIGGLLFLPTNILAMTWGVRFLQEAHGFDYLDAVLRSATVSLGWIIGCPLFGMLSDRVGRRKPVIAGGAALLFICLAWILYGPPGLIPAYVLGVVTGVASGAAMLPFTVNKEANPPELSGTATGVIGFLIFTFTALLGPVFGWLMEHVAGSGQAGLPHYQATFLPLLLGVGVAILLTLALKETGTGRVRAAAEEVKSL